MSGLGRFCCKSRKSNDPENLAKGDFRRAKGDFQRAVTMRGAITPLRRSVVVFSEERRGPPTWPRATRVSVPENFRSSPQKDLCNKIGHFRKLNGALASSALPQRTDIVRPPGTYAKCR